MGLTRWTPVVAIFLMLVTACGPAARSNGLPTTPLASASSPVPSSSPTQSPAPCSDLNPVHEFAASTPSQRNLELVALKGGIGRLVIRDITDIAHPTTVQTFDA